MSTVTQLTAAELKLTLDTKPQALFCSMEKCVPGNLPYTNLRLLLGACLGVLPGCLPGCAAWVYCLRACLGACLGVLPGCTALLGHSKLVMAQWPVAVLNQLPGTPLE